jgi:predicted transcriptional regulator
MKVSEVMTKKIVTVTKDNNLKHVLNLMKKNDITKIPVVENKKPVGMVTDNIIAYKLGSTVSQGGIDDVAFIVKEMEAAGNGTTVSQVKSLP